MKNNTSQIRHHTPVEYLGILRLFSQTDEFASLAPNRSTIYAERSALCVKGREGTRVVEFS